MRIIALEEHFAAPDLVARIDRSAIASRYAVGGASGWSPVEALIEVGAKRLADMDEAGVALQVISVNGPGADLLDATEGPAMARAYNDRLKQLIDAHPDRFAGFAHLPMTAPEAAAYELERAVRELGFHGALINGMTQDLFLDDERFEPILARAERLDAPIYLHPGLAPEVVRRTYYDALPGRAGFILSTAGWGWHAETALHIVRLVLSGTLERHPRLKLVIGHMGEGIPAMLARFDGSMGAEAAKYLKRSISRTILEQVWITISGFYTLPPFLAALHTFGADRILFSVDYPYSSNKAAVDFLEALPVSPRDREKIAFRNAERLLRLDRSGGV